MGELSICKDRPPYDKPSRAPRDSKDSFALSPAVQVAGDLGALGDSPESGKCHCPLGGCAAMTQVDASGVWDPAPKGEPGPQGPAGPQGA